MTVQELIEELQQYDPNMDVKLVDADDDNEGIVDIDYLVKKDRDDDGNKVIIIVWHYGV